MTPEHNLAIASPQRKIGERKLRLPIGIRKHIRRLKQEGNFKEATLVRNAALEHQNREAIKIVADDAP